MNKIPAFPCILEGKKLSAQQQSITKPMMCLSMQTDFRVMCENAMMYNKPETIYHKAAKKLLHSGMKILSPVRPSLLERQRDLTQINNRGQHLASHEDMMLLHA
jgi:hypothetical protein